MHERTAEMSLSERQLEVLRLCARGLDSEQIAEQMGVTVETVRTHLKRTHRRLGARTRAHAVGLAYQQGLLP